MKFESSILCISTIYRQVAYFQETSCRSKPLVKMLLRDAKPILYRKRLGLRQWLIVQFIENDALLANVREEILPLLKVGIHLASGVDDEAHRRFDRLVPDQPIRCLVPVFGELAELAVVDYDQEIEIGAIPLHGEGFIHPSALGVGAEQKNLQDPAALLEVGRAFLQRVLEFLMQDFEDPAELSMLAKRLVILASPNARFVVTMIDVRS